MRERTALMRITSRTIFISNGSSRPLRITVSVIGVLTGPRIFSTACSSVRPAICSPSRCEIRSLACRPALAAGVSSIGETTLMNLVSWSIVTSMPRPPNSPRVCTCMSRKLFGDR